MSKLKDSLPVIVGTALVTGLLLGGFAYYLHTQAKAEQQTALQALKDQHAADLAASAAETRREIAGVNKLLQDAIAARSADAFLTEEEFAKQNAERIEAMAAAVAQKLQPFAPVPKTPEEAERLRNEQVDQVAGRLNDKLSERIQPILTQIAGSQDLTREQLAGYASQISGQITGVLADEMRRNENLQLRATAAQSLAGESMALSHELTALYLSSIKDQGVVTRLLMLPANIVRDAADFSVLNSEQRREKEKELTKRLASIQQRLDGLAPAPAPEPAAEPVRASPTRPAAAGAAAE